MYLYIKPKKRYLRIGLCAKLTRQFVGPFKSLERIGTVASVLEHSMIVKFNEFFHVSLIKKYVKDVDNVID